MTRVDSFYSLIKSGVYKKEHHPRWGGEDGVLDFHFEWSWLLDEWDLRVSNRHIYSDGDVLGRFKKLLNKAPPILPSA